MVFFGFSFFAFGLVFASMTDETVLDVANTLKGMYWLGFEDKVTAFPIGRCSSERELVQSDKLSEASPLRNLARYESICGSFVTNTITISENLPRNTFLAKQKGEDMAKILIEFSAFSVKPIILIDPSNDRGPVDFQELASGSYDKILREYFSTLREQGIRSEMMGVWIPFPSANLPKWNHANIPAKDFVAGVNWYLNVLKEIFPDAKGEILLSSSTYEDDHFEWSDGEYVSLFPYVSGIQSGLVDGFGIEGLPWMPPRESGRFGVLDAREYLNTKLAMEAADSLGIRSIRFFTGTFSEKYTIDDDKKVIFDPGRRKDMLNGIISEVESTKKKGYLVSISLLVTDESASFRATNWSYLSDTVSILHQSVFVDFAVKMNELHTPFSLDVTVR